MSKAPTAPATSPPTTHPVKEPAKTSPLRLGILLGLLVVAVLMTIHHYAFAQPQTQQAYDDIDKKFREQNALGVKTEGGKIDAGLLTPKDISELLGKQPWSRVEEPEQLVEYYWWFGLPDRNYVAVKYVGKKGSWRFDTHYLNQKPPKEEDSADLNNSPPTDTPPTTGDGGQGDQTPAPPGPPRPMTETPSDKPADEPADKPADKPADEPAADKPATPSEDSK